MQIQRLPEFDKEFKKLSQKYHSLEDDFCDFENALITCPKEHILIE